MTSSHDVTPEQRQAAIEVTHSLIEEYVEGKEHYVREALIAAAGCHWPIVGAYLSLAGVPLDRWKAAEALLR